MLAPTTGDDWPSMMTPVFSLQGESPHLVIINASPIEEMHVLFCPRCFDRLPQQLTPDTVESAVAFAALTTDRQLRMGFNSLHAAASVNHLHFHLYKLPFEVPLEAASTSLITRLRDGTFGKLTNYPINGLVFQWPREKSNLLRCRDTMRLLHSSVEVLQQRSIPHNM